MTFCDTIETRSLVLTAKRVNVQPGAIYTRTAFVSLSKFKTESVKVTRVTKHQIVFSDGGRIRKTDGRAIGTGTSIVSYAPMF